MLENEIKRIYNQQDGWSFVEEIERDDNREMSWHTRIFYNKDKNRYIKIRRVSGGIYSEQFSANYVEKTNTIKWLDK
mgnify:CR=1 FL=1